MSVTLGEIYRLCVLEGIKADLRRRQEVNAQLKAAQHEFRKTKQPFKKFFDKESLKNPYADTRILFGDERARVKRVMVGIDIEVGELLLADRLSQQERDIDLVIAHHPEGVALSGLDEVMGLQADVLAHLGLAPKIAGELLKKRKEEVARRLHGSNHERTVDAARLLNIPLMTCHTPSDNLVARHLQQRFDKLKPRALDDIVRILLQYPEYQGAARIKAGPHILVGKGKDLAGKIFVDMTGGTEGSKDVFARLSQAGVKTLVCMHLSEAHYERVRSEFVNVIVAGHIASDNLGLNLLLDKLERKAELEIVECSGFRRFKRP